MLVPGLNKGGVEITDMCSAGGTLAAYVIPNIKYDQVGTNTAQ